MMARGMGFGVNVAQIADKATKATANRVNIVSFVALKWGHPE
jgi:hypothetical protein